MHLVKLMHCVRHASRANPRTTNPLDGGPAPRSGIRGRGRSRDLVQLLDRARPLVDDAMRQSNRTATLDMNDSICTVSHPAAHSPVHPSIPPTADAAFTALFDSSGEALVIIDSAGAIQRSNPARPRTASPRGRCQPARQIGRFSSGAARRQTEILLGRSSFVRARTYFGRVTHQRISRPHHPALDTARFPASPSLLGRRLHRPARGGEMAPRACRTSQRA